MDSTLAPIVLFTYNRPRHTKATLDALKANLLAKESVLYIYQDGLKDNATKEQKDSALEVSTYLQDFIASNENGTYFKHITFIQRERNLGLADSIIDGVTSIINKHGTIIVLEDDIVVSPVFLDYMNAALKTYQNEPKVWSIAGWGYPIATQGLGDCYFWRLPHCWGWASWSSRWQYFKRDMSLDFKNSFSKSDIAYINLDGVADYFSHFTLNHKGRLKTWAIFNYLIAYKHNALTLCPSLSYIKQIGFDGSGVHCGDSGNIFNVSSINTKFPIIFPKDIVESTLALKRIRSFELAHKITLQKRVANKLAKLSTTLHNKLTSMIAHRGGAAHSFPVIAYADALHYECEQGRAA